MSRLTPDGAELRWTLTRRAEPGGDGLVPFLIDWESTPHPSRAAAKGCRLVGLRAEHPRPDLVSPLLEALEVELEIDRGPRPRLVASIATANGAVEL